MKIVLLLLTLLVNTWFTCIAQPLAGTYTIGGSSPAFLTINEAVDTLVSKGVSGPVVFNIRSGIYAERFSIPPITGASGMNTIKFRPETGNADDVQIISPGGNKLEDHHVIQLNGADHIIFESLTVKNIGPTYGSGFHLTFRADSNVISNCSIWVDTAFNSRASTLAEYGTPGYISFAGIIAADTASKQPTMGLPRKGWSGSYNLIDNNKIHGQYGIILMGMDTKADVYNRISDNQLWVANHGLIVWRNDTIDISRNRIDTVKNKCVGGLAVLHGNGIVFKSNRLTASIMASRFWNLRNAVISDNIFEGSVYNANDSHGPYLTSVIFTWLRTAVISNNQFLGSHNLNFSSGNTIELTGNYIEGGTYWEAAMFGPMPKKIRISNNYIKVSTSYTANINKPAPPFEINIYGARKGDYAEDFLIDNNMIIDPHQGQRSNVIIPAGKNIRIVNNSFLCAGKADTAINTVTGTKTYGLSPLLDFGTVSDLQIINNIFRQSVSGAIFKIDEAVQGTFEFDYNLFYTNGPVVGIYEGKQYTTLNDVIRVTGFCKNTLFGDPGYVSNTDLHITKPLADGMGIPSAEIQMDYDQELRDTIYPDIGADEVQFPAYHDIAVSSIEPLISPLGNVLIKIILINKGGISLKDSLIRLSYSTDNGLIWTLPEQLKITALSKFRDTESYIFLTSWNPVQARKFNVCVRIESPGIVPDLNKENDQLCEDLCISLKAGAYTIDNSGVPADFISINSAVEWLGSLGECGIAGPIVFNIRPGIYNERVSIPFINGTSAVNTITFQSATGNPDDVNITNTVADTFLMYNVNVSGSYIRLRNLTFTSKANTLLSQMLSTLIGQYATPTNTSSLPHVLLLGSGRGEHITVSGCKIHIDTSSWIGITNLVTGIYVTGSATTLENNQLFDGAGIQLFSTNQHNDGRGNLIKDPDSTVIQGNQLYRTTGIEATYSTNIVIRKNLIDSTIFTNSETETAIFLAGVNNAVIEHNQIYKAASMVHLISWFGNNEPNRNVLFSNNTASCFKPATTKKISMDYKDFTFPAVVVISNISKLRFINNSISYMLPHVDHNALLHLRSPDYGPYAIPIPQQIELLNNIFYTTAGAELIRMEIPLNVNYAPNLLSSDYNNWYQALSNAGTRFGMIGTVSVPDFTSWKTITGLDKHSISVNPAFFNDSLDLHTLNPALDKKALYLDEIRNDMDYEARSNRNPDIGADEFVLDNIDLAVVDIDPKAGVLGDNMVTVTLSNEGLSSLNGKQVSLSFSPDSLNWSTAEFFTLSALSSTYDKEIITFNTSYVISQTIGNRLFVRINTPLVGDVYQLNEILKIDVCVSIRGAYAVGPSAPYFPDLKTVSDLLHDIPCGIQNPVVFELESGIYNEQISIPFIEGMSASNTITFRSKTGKAADVVITSGLNTAEGHYTVQVNRTGHVRIENLTIRNTGEDYASGIHLSDSVEDVLIKNCKISLDTTATSMYTSGILLSRAEDLNAAGRAVNIRIENNEIKGGSNGITLNALSIFNNRNIRITGNTIRDVYANAIISEGNNIEEISRNKIYLPDRSDFDYGLQLFSNNAAFHISGNYFNKCGLYLDNCKPANGGEISNNMLGGKLQSSIRGEGIKIARSENIRLLYNSVYMEGRNALNTTALQVTDGKNIELVNNIFSNGWGGYAFSAKNGGITASDYNDWYTTGPTLAKWQNLDKATLADLQSASGKEQHSLSVDPKFISTDNLHTLSPALDGKATPFAGITLDYDGQVRSTSAPDIGADEYTLGLDAALTELISPAANQSITAGDVMPVQVRITNSGSAVLTAASVSYSVNGQVQETDSLTGLNLNPGASFEHPFDKTWTPLAQGAYSLCSKVNVAGDINAANDQTCGTYTVNEKLGKDGAVTEIISPASGQVLYEGEEITVKIKVSNPGNVTLTDIPVSYSINGNLVGNGTVTGSLAPAAVAEHEFTMKWTPSATGTIDLCATASVQDDIDALNDKKCGSWQVQEAIKIDGGVSEFRNLLPAQTVTAGQEQTIKIRIKNYGNISISEVPVSCWLNGTLISSDTTPVSWGSLASGAYKDYTFQTKWVAAQKDTGAAELCARTDLVADVDAINDKTCIPITIKPGTTGLENTAISIHSLLVYPNPASTTIHLKWEEQAQAEAIQIRLYNSIGSTVLDQQVSGSQQEAEADIAHLATGMYILEVKAKGYLQREKIIIGR